MLIPRFQLSALRSAVKPGKVIVIYGPRRVGKTTLVKMYLAEEKDVLFVSGDDIFIHDYLSSRSIEKLKDFIGSYSLLVIDEAQEINDIGANLKLIVDHLPQVKIIATGSSTFDLTRKLGEPLTGRHQTIQIYPISQIELQTIEHRAETKAHLESRLLYGSYPEVLNILDKGEKEEYLRELVSSYLLKDILILDGIHNAKIIFDLLVLLALQIGKEVSLTELATQLSLNKATLSRYLDLLEKVFVLVNIRGFSRNLRKEVTKTSRYYFYDLGIRNALLNNFNLLKQRDDVDALWENYLVIERLKKQELQKIRSNNYFWRTYDQKEIDWVEEKEGKLFAYEFKWGKPSTTPPKLWNETYPNSTYTCVSQDNYLEFIT